MLVQSFRTIEKTHEVMWKVQLCASSVTTVCLRHQRWLIIIIIIAVIIIYLFIDFFLQKNFE